MSHVLASAVCSKGICLWVSVVECPDPNVLQNGDVSPPQERYYVHNQTTYECYSGHKLRGSSRRVCLPNGKWSGSTPICSRDGTSWTPYFFTSCSNLWLKLIFPFMYHHSRKYLCWSWNPSRCLKIWEYVWIRWQSTIQLRWQTFSGGVKRKSVSGERRVDGHRARMLL